MREWGGADRPLALLHHANGFCKELWAPVAGALAQGYRVVAMDARGHGDSSHPEEPSAYAWTHFAEDLVAVAEALARPVGRVALGIGHSFGGTSMLGAAARRPELFERLVLVDPVTPPPPGTTPPGRLEHVEGLVEGARRRRDGWASREEARAWFGERRLFSAWLPEALDLYVAHGLRQGSDGSLRLKCPGSVEAAVFSGGDDVDVFSLAAGVAVPCLWLWASGGSFPREVYEVLAASMGEAELRAIEAGHLAPMERPDLVLEAVEEFTGRLGPAEAASGRAPARA